MLKILFIFLASYFVDMRIIFLGMTLLNLIIDGFNYKTITNAMNMIFIYIFGVKMLIVSLFYSIIMAFITSSFDFMFSPENKMINNYIDNKLNYIFDIKKARENYKIIKKSYKDYVNNMCKELFNYEPYKQNMFNMENMMDINKMLDDELDKFLNKKDNDKLIDNFENMYLPKKTKGNKQMTELMLDDLFKGFDMNNITNFTNSQRGTLGKKPITNEQMEKNFNEMMNMFGIKL